MVPQPEPASLADKALRFKETDASVQALHWAIGNYLAIKSLATKRVNMFSSSV